jgi:hypothetical protein
VNKLLFISGIVVLAATFLITNTPNTTMAYSCSSSIGTSGIHFGQGISGSSGSCATSSSASTTNSGHNFSNTLRISGPNKFAALAIVISPLGLQAASPVGVGGAQTSCSSSSTTTSGGITLNSNSVSKSGTCP